METFVQNISENVDIYEPVNIMSADDLALTVIRIAAGMMQYTRTLAIKAGI